MRIASINQDAGIRLGSPKGAAVHLARMREAFRSLGAEVVCFDEKSESALDQRLEEAWREQGFDMLYERLALGKTAGARFARRRELPFVVEVNAPLIAEEERWRDGSPDSGLGDAESFVFRSADGVLAVSTLVADYALGNGARKGSVHVVPNGVDTARFVPRREEELRRELVPPDRVGLLFHGRLRPWHGFELLAEAVSRLVREKLPVHLLLVGKGDFDAHLAGAVPPERVTRVEWVGHEEVPAYVRAADVLPLSYRPETECYFSPLKLMEAMASGVVPVVPDLGDLPGIVQTGRNGIVYPAGNVTELCRSIARLVEDPDARREMARVAHRDAQDHSWEAIASFVLQRFGGQRV